MNRFLLTEVANAIDGVPVALPSPMSACGRIELDSRRIQPGDLFWAVRGETHDGHDFVADAVAAGAVAAVVSRDRAERCPGAKIVVADTRTALAALGQWHRDRIAAEVIGVTGSVGKTTTKSLIHTVLSAGLTGTESPGNFNNHFGLPLSLLGIRPNDRYAVMELGASAVGEIRHLASVAKPDIGVVTAVELSHVSGFGSLDHITIAKGELVEALPHDGLAVLAGDNPRVRSMTARTRARVLLVGEGADNDVRPIAVRSIPGRMHLRVDGHDYSLAATGRHLLTSALIAIALGREFGLTAAQIAEGFSRFRPMRGRGEIRRFGTITVIDDTYNANPGSMRAAIHVLRDWAGPGRCILVAGDMLELGPYASGCHRQMGEEAAACGIHGIIAMGSHAVDVVDGARLAGHPAQQSATCQDLDEVMSLLDEWLEPGDVVLVKGSRGMRMERIVQRLEQGWGIAHRDASPLLSKAS